VVFNSYSRPISKHSATICRRMSPTLVNSVESKLGEEELDRKPNFVIAYVV